MASNTKAFEDSSKHNNTASCCSSSEYGSTDDPAASDATVSGHDRTDITPSLEANLTQTFGNNDCTNSTPLRHPWSIPLTDDQYHDVRPVDLQLKGSSTTIVTLRITNGERVYVNETLGFGIEPICSLKQGSEGCRVMIYGYKERDTNINKFVAGKRMDKQCYPRFQKEIDTVAKFSDHDNIARYDAHSCSDKEFAVLFTELCDFSLQEFCEETLKTEESCPMLKPKEMLKQAIQAIKYLHGNNVVHMDIKPSNILFKKRRLSASKECYVLKLIDFGLSKHLNPDSSTSVSREAVGTRSYMSPEHYKDGFKPNPRTDIFSLGLLFHYVITKGKNPFGAKENKIASNIEEYEVQSSFATLDSDNEEDVLAKDLVLRMIQKLPEDRPTIEEVEIHPYFWDAGKKDSFYRAVDKIINLNNPYGKKEVKVESNDFLASLNNSKTNMKIDDLKLPHIPKYEGKRNKQTGELPDMYYKNVQTYVRFVRNTLEHWDDCFAHLKKEEKDKLPKKIEDRLRMLTSAYPDILRDLYYKLVTDANFQDKFGELAKIDLTKVKSKIQDPKKDGAV